jgi:hypothetical protein
VVDAYLTYVAGGEEALLAAEHGRAAPGAPETAPPAPAEGPDRHGYREGRWGSREVEITRVRLLDSRGRERHVYVSGEDVCLALDVRADAPHEDFVFGVGIFAADGVSVYGTNTHIEEWKPRKLAGAAEVRLRLDDLRLVEGTYLLDVAVHRRDGTPYDYHRGMYSFRVKSHLKDVGVYRPAHLWEFGGGIEVDPPPARAELSLDDDDLDLG